MEGVCVWGGGGGEKCEVGGRGWQWEPTSKLHCDLQNILQMKTAVL